MATSTARATSWTPRNLTIVTVLLAIVIGAASGYAGGVLSRPATAAQNREFFLFAQDQHFSDSQVASGLTSDYVYSATQLTVNKGDTVTIHFYNPTDQTHTFTMGSPYTNDAVVQAATNTTIGSHDIVFTATTQGSFTFHCRFHAPQMTGTVIVQ